MTDIETRKAAALEAFERISSDASEAVSHLLGSDAQTKEGDYSLVAELLQPSPPVAAGEVDARYKADKYLHELQHGRLSSQDHNFDGELLNPVFDTGAEHAQKVVAEILKRCSLSAYEVDQIRIFFKAAQQPRQEFTDELIDLLHIMWDGYENGQPCYEFSDDGEQEGFLGNAFQIVDDKERRICEILNKHRPVKTLPSTPKERR